MIYKRVPSEIFCYSFLGKHINRNCGGHYHVFSHHGPLSHLVTVLGSVGPAIPHGDWVDAEQVHGRRVPLTCLIFLAIRNGCRPPYCHDRYITRSVPLEVATKQLLGVTKMNFISFFTRHLTGHL